MLIASTRYCMKSHTNYSYKPKIFRLHTGHNTNILDVYNLVEKGGVAYRKQRHAIRKYRSNNSRGGYRSSIGVNQLKTPTPGASNLTIKCTQKWFRYPINKTNKI